MPQRKQTERGKRIIWETAHPSGGPLGLAAWGYRPSPSPTLSPGTTFSSEASLFQPSCLGLGRLNWEPETDGDSAFSLHPHQPLRPLTHLLICASLHLLGRIPTHDSPGLPESPILYLSLQLTCRQPMQPSSKNPNAVFLLWASFLAACCWEDRAHCLDKVYGPFLISFSGSEPEYWTPVRASPMLCSFALGPPRVLFLLLEALLLFSKLGFKAPLMCYFSKDMALLCWALVVPPLLPHCPPHTISSFFRLMTASHCYLQEGRKFPIHYDFLKRIRKGWRSTPWTRSSLGVCRGIYFSSM